MSGSLVAVRWSSELAIHRSLLSSSVRDGVLKEVMGIMVSYRVMVKLIIGG